MLQKGFRFGMILQLAIGPICIFVLNTALSQGFLAGELAVLGTVVTDGTEIVLAIIGIGVLLDKSTLAKRIFKIFGIVILTVYGISALLSAFDLSILPSLSLPWISNNPFLQAILLALSNPLTIVFWAGIFSAKLLEEHMQGHDLHHFALGCALSTLCFLSLIACVGAIFAPVIPAIVIQILNMMVGIFMLWFAYKNSKIDIK